MGEEFHQLEELHRLVLVCEFDRPMKLLAFNDYFYIHFFVVFNTFLSHISEYTDVWISFFEHVDWIILLTARAVCLLLTLGNVQLRHELTLLLGLDISLWSDYHIEESLHILRNLEVRELILNRSWNSIFFNTFR